MADDSLPDIPVEDFRAYQADQFRQYAASRVQDVLHRADGGAAADGGLPAPAVDSAADVSAPADALSSATPVPVASGSPPDQATASAAPSPQPGALPDVPVAEAAPQAQPQAQPAPTPTPVPAPPTPAGAATQAALNAGAAPNDLVWARQHMGQADYVNWCEKFVENATGTTGQYPSAAAAANAYQAQGRLRTDFEHAQPGDLVYYGAHPENGGYGHAAILNDANSVVSSASSQPTPLAGYFRGPLLGYVPQGSGASDAGVPGTTMGGTWDAAQTVPAGPPQPPASAAGGESFLDYAQRRIGEVLGDAGTAVAAAPSWASDKARGLIDSLPNVTGFRPNVPIDQQDPAAAPAGSIASQVSADNPLLRPDLASAEGIHAFSSELGEQAGSAVHAALPDWAKDVPAVEGILQGALNPEMAPGSATGELAGAASGKVLGAVGSAVGPALGAAKDAIGEALDLAFPSRSLARALEQQAAAGVPLMGGGAPSIAEQGADALASAAGKVSRLPSGAQFEVQRLLAPVKNTPPAFQAVVRQFADDLLGNVVEKENIVHSIESVLGKSGEGKNTLDSMLKLETVGTLGLDQSPEEGGLAQSLKDFAERTGEEGRRLGFIKGDVTKEPELAPLAPGMSQTQRGRPWSATNPEDVKAPSTKYRGRPSGELSNAEEGLDETRPAMYVPHVYEKELEAAEQLMKQDRGKKGLSPRDYYSNARVFPTLGEAMAYGLTPVNSVSEPFAVYSQHVLDSISKGQFIEASKNLGQFVKPAAGQKAPRGLVYLGSADRALEGYYGTPEVKKVVDNMFDPGWVNKHLITQGMIRVLGVAKENLFSLSGFHLATEMRQAYRAAGPIDGTKVAAQALWNAVNPAGFNSFRLQNADAFLKWAQAGVTGLARGERGADIEGGPLAGLKGMLGRAAVGGTEGAVYGAASAKQQGASDEDVLKRALMFGGAGAVLGPTVGAAVSKALWERAVPTLKVASAELLGQKYAPQEVATFINQTFGGQNLGAIARSKTVQDIVRLVALSPDWWEGWARQIVSGLKGMVGQGGDLGKMSRGYWWRTAAIDGAFGLEGLNYAINRHLTNDNEQGRQFDLEITGLVGRDAAGQRQYLDILGPIKPLLQLASSGNIGQFVNTRTSLPVSIGLSAHEDKDYAGRTIVQPGTPALRAGAQYAAYAAQRIAPIGLQTAGQATMSDQNTSDLSQTTSPGKTVGETAFTALTGMRTSAGPSGQSLYDQRDAIVADLLPGYRDQLRNSPAFQKAPPDERSRMLNAAQADIQNEVAKQIGLPLRQRDYGAPSKYRGVTDPNQQVAIDHAITAAHLWQRDPKVFPKPDAASMQLANRYDGNVSPAWNAWNKAQQQESDRAKSAVSGLVAQALGRGAGPVPGSPVPGQSAAAAISSQWGSWGSANAPARQPDMSPEPVAAAFGSWGK